jgi:hypothetical protein
MGKLIHWFINSRHKAENVKAKWTANMITSTNNWGKHHHSKEIEFERASGDADAEFKDVDGHEEWTTLYNHSTEIGNEEDIGDDYMFGGDLTEEENDLWYTASMEHHEKDNLIWTGLGMCFLFLLHIILLLFYAPLILYSPLILLFNTHFTTTIFTPDSFNLHTMFQIHIIPTC